MTVSSLIELEPKFDGDPPRPGMAGIAIVTIDNQPRLNAMTRQMLAELGRLWDELERDDVAASS